MRKDADRLYGLPLDEFTRERDALARRLRGEGERDGAAEVAALRKPVLAAWVVNQLARRRKAEMRELLQAAKAVKAGRKDADERFRARSRRSEPVGKALLADDGQQCLRCRAAGRGVDASLRGGLGAGAPGRGHASRSRSRQPGSRRWPVPPSASRPSLCRAEEGRGPARPRAESRRRQQSGHGRTDRGTRLEPRGGRCGDRCAQGACGGGRSRRALAEAEARLERETVGLISPGGRANLPGPGASRGSGSAAARRTAALRVGPRGSPRAP